MKLIFYDDAASMLGVKLNTINQAIERGILTRAGRNGRNMLLMEEQVKLFTGKNHRTGNKKRLSLVALSKDEREQWKSYKTQALQSFKMQDSQGQMAVNNAPDIEEITRIAQQTAQATYSQGFISMIESVRELIEGGVPQGAFFQEHPILANITYALLIAASLASAMLLFNALNDQEKKEALAYVGMVDATLQFQERMEKPPISIEEIRQRRARIAQFKQEASKVA